jgi:RNA polymerase sigma factor (sigma-70 family)
VTGSLPAELVALLSGETADARDEAWERFLAKESPLLLHVCRSFGGGTDAAMDRYALVLEGLREDDFRRLRQFVPGRNARFTTWLVVVARRLCLEHQRHLFGRVRGEVGGDPEPELLLRRRLALGLAADIDVAEVAGSESAGSHEGLERAEQQTALQRAIAELPSRDQLLLQLRYEGEYTATEIARVLGFPTPFHVYRRLRVLLVDLRKALQSRGVEQG